MWQYIETAKSMLGSKIIWPYLRPLKVCRYITTIFYKVKALLTEILENKYQKNEGRNV